MSANKRREEDAAAIKEIADILIATSGRTPYQQAEAVAALFDANWDYDSVDLWTARGDLIVQWSRRLILTGKPRSVPQETQDEFVEATEEEANQ